MASLPPCSVSKDSFLLSSKSFMIPPRTSTRTTGIYGSPLKFEKIEDTRLRFLGSVKTNPALRLEASRETLTSTQEVPIHKMESVEENDGRPDLFSDIKHRFLSFKRSKYLEKSDHFQKLAKGQAPKFMVIACADSRVCPSSILGFEPGEAFMVRNVANLVPPLENGPSETNAALEFAVNSLKVENLFVIGHSCCGGIRALMSMQDEVDSGSFIRNWVVIGKHARSSTQAAAANLSFEQQCRHCEKESVNHSLVNLLTYPWIEERARQGLLSIHGGYYDFVNCTFEKWTLDYKGSNVENGKYAIKDRAFWS
ncbi:Carbonic anhydrase [Macleaya cordata]|uniref:Carbonic anhydrase n=1 Tax=Macleaya cordata TaxID=56857 RepID=A0A200PNK7_MACCD|nr:Carbonic anhydrase [Macleaya cordata]